MGEVMRARIEERTPFPWSVKEPLLKETNGVCAHCGTPLDRYTNLSVDHFIPLNKGGTNDSGNLTVLCDDCNLEKSDMVLPPVWYPYLGKRKKEQLRDRFVRFMKETDYLSEDNLVPVDMFRIESMIETSKRNHILRMPVYINGIRVTKEEGFEWLMEYKRSLAYRDQESMFTKPSDFMAPAFMLKKGDIEIALVNPWLSRDWDSEKQLYYNTVKIDWFFSPKMPDRGYLPQMLAYMALGMEAYIAKAMSVDMTTACAVLFQHRCYNSDRFCNPVLDILEKGRKSTLEEAEVVHGTLKSQIRIITAFNIIGTHKAAAELIKKLDKKYEDRQMCFEDVVEETRIFNKRFE